MMMKRKDVVALTGLCYTTIYNLEKQGGFPARRQLSPGRVAWMRSEVMPWLQNRGCAGVEPLAAP
jgi:prophage regulatory protein